MWIHPPQNSGDHVTAAGEPHDRRGVLIVGHGTRDPAGVAEFHCLSAGVAQRLEPLVCEACFLELVKPSIDVAVARLVRRGVRRLTVLPVMLFAARHVLRDIPREVRQALDAIGGSSRTIAVDMAPALECQADMVRLSVRRFFEALQAAPVSRRTLGHGGAYGKQKAAVGRHPAICAPGAGKVTLLLVGRGNRNAEAQAMIGRFLRAHCRLSQPEEAEIAYLAMAEPRFEDALARLADSDRRRIVVQPHLLFEGLLMRQIRQVVGELQAQQPDRWLLAEPLGPEPPLVQALIARATDGENGVG